MSRVRLSNVRKVYDGGVEAVHAFDLDVADGEFVVLVGPSGSGKSTVLRMIAGLEEVTGGEIHIGDRLVNRLHPKDRDVAMVFQDYALYPHMTVAENMGFGLRVRRMPRDEIRKRVEQTAELIGIGDLLRRRPSALSGGQQQRVALGRAIVREPAVFLFDEPLSNLDAGLRVRMRSEIRRIQQRVGTTSIYVTHDQEEAMTMADRIVVMCEGRMQQVDTPRGAFNNPANRFVAAFIGSPSMNFIEGSITGANGELVFEERGEDPSRLRLPLPVATGAERSIVDCRIVLGIRPSGFVESGAASFSVTVEQAEFIGDAVDVRGITPGGQPIVARVPAGSDVPSGAMDLCVDPGAAHLFEPGAFGRNVTREYASRAT